VSTAATSPAVPCRNPPLGPGPCSARTDDPPRTRAGRQTTFFRLRGGARCTGPAAAGPASPGSSGIDDRSRGPLRPDRRLCAPVVLRPIWPCAARPAESAVCAPFSYVPSAPAKCRRCTVPGFKCLQCSRSALHTPPRLAFRRGVACMHPRHVRRRVPTLRPVHLARKPTAAPNRSPPPPSRGQRLAASTQPELAARRYLARAGAGRAEPARARRRRTGSSKRAPGTRPARPATPPAWGPSPGPPQTPSLRTAPAPETPCWRAGARAMWRDAAGRRVRRRTPPATTRTAPGVGMPCGARVSARRRSGGECGPKPGLAG
jgi:hypothetical protein